MEPYVFFIERDVVFTPSAMNGKGEHVFINVVTPSPFQRQRQRNSETGRHETAVHISPNFEGEFWVVVSIGRKTRQQVWLEIEVEEGGVIAAVTIIDGNPEGLSLVGIKFPSGEWAANSVYEWYRYPIHSANSCFVWLP